MLKKLRGGRPSAPMVLSVIALVFSIAGTGFAGVATISKLTKSEKKQTKGIAKNQVNQLAPNLSVKSAKSAETVNDGAITAAKLAGGSVVASKLGTLVERSNSDEFATGSGTTVTAECQAGERVISGGTNTAGVGTELGFTITRASRSGNGWSAVARNETGDDATLIVEAFCLQQQ